MKNLFIIEKSQTSLIAYDLVEGEWKCTYYQQIKDKNDNLEVVFTSLRYDMNNFCETNDNNAYFICLDNYQISYVKQSANAAGLKIVKIENAAVKLCASLGLKYFGYISENEVSLYDLKGTKFSDFDVNMNDIHNRLAEFFNISTVSVHDTFNSLKKCHSDIDYPVVCKEGSIFKRVTYVNSSDFIEKFNALLAEEIDNKLQNIESSATLFISNLYFVNFNRSRCYEFYRGISIDLNFDLSFLTKLIVKDWLTSIGSVNSNFVSEGKNVNKTTIANTNIQISTSTI